ncbi:MAG: hypothetical protein KDB01_01025 [Planctomycetaceae bacterium]|nr:hypothetical protein [Planctomycetaceae bacterium]
MKNWSRLILPLGLGILATVINAGAMTNRLAPTVLVKVNRQLKPGERFTVADLIPAAVGYPSSHLNQHFWTWSERDALLQEVGSPVQLETGDLVPKSPFRNHGRNIFSIPENSVVVGFRFHESAMKSEERHLLLPGRNVKLTFRGEGTVKSAKIAFLEPSREKGSKDIVGQYFQMGVLLSRGDQYDVDLLGTGEINQIVGLSDGYLSQ